MASSINAIIVEILDVTRQPAPEPCQKLKVPVFKIEAAWFAIKENTKKLANATQV
jgi:hypothetical protein